MVGVHRPVEEAPRGGGGDEGENEFAVAKVLKLWGPSKDAILARGRELGPAGARRALKAAVEGDQRIKSSLGDAERTLEVVTVRLTSMLRPRR